MDSGRQYLGSIFYGGYNDPDRRIFRALPYRRRHHPAPFPAAGTRRIPVELVMVAGGFIDDTVFGITPGTGVTDDIPGPRARDFRMNGMVCHGRMYLRILFGRSFSLPRDPGISGRRVQKGKGGRSFARQYRAVVRPKPCMTHVLLAGKAYRMIGRKSSSHPGVPPAGRSMLSTGFARAIVFMDPFRAGR